MNKQYAIAFFEIAKEDNTLNECKESFDVFLDVLKSEKDLALVLNSPKIKTNEKKDLIKNAFVHNVDKGMIHIIVEENSIKFSNSGSLVALDGKRVFERFYQGIKKEGSTGLGLAIATAICRQFNLSLNYTFENNMHHFVVCC